jgi:DNA repair protein RadC
MAAEATEAILTRYGSYAEAVAAPLHELRAIPSVGDTAATLLKCIHSSVARLTSIPLRQNPVLKDWPALSAYLNVCIGHERTEFCRVLFLNAKNYLIADQILSEGDINSVQVPIRAITKRALELEATGLILVHNHPSGDPTPSEADRVMTERVSHAVSTFGIVVHDHIIVGKSECFSMQRRAYMASYQPTSTS